VAQGVGGQSAGRVRPPHDRQCQRILVAAARQPRTERRRPGRTSRAALPVRQRTVLVLRYYEDLDDATIAEILDISPVTVRTTAMRALHTLRERYTYRLTPMPGSNR
jgi:DNA-directed RNA polymerase specialized sigma24 family protein